jgi:hypothetical protein
MSENTVESLIEAETLTDDDLFLVTKKSGNDWISKKMTAKNLFGSPPPSMPSAKIEKLDTSPQSSASSIGEIGTMKYDDEYLYIQVGENNIRRIQHFEW